jgi:membrane associated rhomboid family serine protease
MFFIIPWRVDVPQDRWPVMNWLIILATVGVFWLQIVDLSRYEAQDNPPVPPGQSRDADAAPSGETSEPSSQELREPPGITGELILRGWSLKGLVGYMWLHAGLFHLLGNMWFLWIFGNAICAKIGNLRYLPLYVFLGVVAAVAHLLGGAGSAVGASGAINGIVGMYLFLFFENEITCLLVVWLILPIYVRWFTVGSVSMILFWLFWDIMGLAVFRGSSNVAYFAHVGGFAAGFGTAWLMCRTGWITMERYEKSLLEWWQERQEGHRKGSFDATYARLGLSATERGEQPEPEPGTTSESEKTQHDPLANGFIRAPCTCGKVLEVSGQYAGRVVRCPTCGNNVAIPTRDDSHRPARRHGRAAAKMPNGYVRLTCKCGKRIKLPVRYAGRTAKCPQCGHHLKVPNVSDSPPAK